MENEEKGGFEHSIGNIFAAIDSQKMFSEVKQTSQVKPQGQMGQGLSTPGEPGRPGGRQNNG